MYRNLLKSVLAATVLSVAWTLNANQIEGGVSLSGNVTFLSGGINHATGFQVFNGVTVASVSGSYADAHLLPGTGVAMTAFQFNPFLPAGVLPLWETFSGPKASFNLTSLSSVQQGDDALTLRGAGTLYLAGYDPTPGLWIFTAQGLCGTFSFSSSNGALPSVPDGACTLLLLGTALVRMAFIRPKAAQEFLVKS